MEALLVGEGLTGLNSSRGDLFFKMETRPLEGKVYKEIEPKHSD